MRDTPLFRLSEVEIIPAQERRVLEARSDAGAFVAFEGWVRNHHAGRSVLRLAYTANPALAVRTGQHIVAELVQQNTLLGASVVHRLGLLEIGEIAVWVGVCAAHRDSAFEGCRALIDRIKAEVPIWKHEHYTNNEKTWVGADVVKNR
jgi:molybdopterin synthase catalytic subunit